MKFKVGDRVRGVKNSHGFYFIIGKLGTIKHVFDDCYAVEFDNDINGHSCDGYAKMGYGLWCDDKMLEPVYDNNKIKVGEKYRVKSFGKENGNVIEIAKITGSEVYYRTLVGTSDHSNMFQIGSNFHECLIPYVDNSKIVITTDGKTTIAKMYDGKNFVKSAKAVCSPDDEFDFKKGAGIAISRLLDYEFVPLEETLLNTKICIIKGDEHLETGHIYEIVNGKFQCDVVGNGKSNTFPVGFRLKSIDDLKAYLSYERNSNCSHFSTTAIKFIEVVE